MTPARTIKPPQRSRSCHEARDESAHGDAGVEQRDPGGRRSGIEPLDFEEKGPAPKTHSCLDAAVEEQNNQRKFDALDFQRKQKRPFGRFFEEPIAKAAGPYFVPERNGENEENHKYGLDYGDSQVPVAPRAIARKQKRED